MSIRTDSKTTYFDLVARLKNGETIDCLINHGIWKGAAIAEYSRRFWGELFTITINEDSVMISSEPEFIEFCVKQELTI
ncbi:MAG: hypothetical protein ACXVA2_24870 [Mucilaginibacter sp.]